MGTHAPPEQVWPGGQVAPSHGSMHAPLMHSVPCGQRIPSQGPTHAPPRHTCPSAHCTPPHLGSTHTPVAASHASAAAQANSADCAQWGTHAPLTHTWSAGQV